MSNEMLKYFMIGIGALFAVIVIAFLIIKKKSENSEIAQIRKLREGTKEKSFSSEVMYQKLYVFYLKTPFFKRYLLKLRRRLAIINVDDEYLTRKQASKILTNTMLIVLPLAVAIIAITKNNTLLMTMLLIFELFMIDTFIDGMVDKLDNKLLKEQIDFFSEIRHAYHEFNMVEEAIYQVAQDDDKPEMSRQAEKIYEVLISNDPESELEKYYDVAPNSYLKEFNSYNVSDAISCILNKKVADVITKNLKLSNKTICDISKTELENISYTLKNMHFNITSTGDFETSQVTLGGALLSEFTNHLESKKISGLYASGEVLDVDGICGGYNLSWAFTSALIVAEGILKDDLK